MNPRPVAELTDDLVDEILLRLPPGEPSCLARASAVCKRWRRLFSDLDFLRRYRAYHRAPPLLGNVVDRDFREHFVPTTALPIPPPPLEFPCGMVLDCRHGRVLLDVSGETLLAIWHPLTGQLRRLPRPDFTSFVYVAGAVLCSADGCDHLDCLGGPFLVVVVGTNVEYGEMWSTVYSSDSDAWGPQTFFHHGEHAVVDDMMPAALIVDALYFPYVEREGIGILKFHLGEHSLSLIDPPAVFTEDTVPFVLRPLEGGLLGLASLELEDQSLSLWSRDVSLGGAARWEKRNVIELSSVLPSRPSRVCTGFVADLVVLPIAFVEGADIIFVSTFAGVFKIELRSMCAKQVLRKVSDHAVIPYTSFYSPGVHLQQTNTTELSLVGSEQPSTVAAGC